MNRRDMIAFASAALGTSLVTGRGQAKSAAAAQGPHRLVLHVDRDEPEAMRIALGNAANAASHYAGRRETVALEVVANGPGVKLLRADTTAKAHIEAARKRLPDLALSACGNAMKMVEREDGKRFDLIAGAREVPAGIARLAELQERGWSYVKP